MTGAQVAAAFRAKRTGKGRWVAKCSAHPDRKPSLSIWEGREAVMLKCQSHGCDTKAILDAVGLRYSDLWYQSRITDPKAMRELERKRMAENQRSSNLRVGTWILRFIEEGYTRKDRENDVAAVCACAIVLSHKEMPQWNTWNSIFETHMERIIAADHCLSRKMMPKYAKPRLWSDDMPLGCMSRWPPSWDSRYTMLAEVKRG